MYVCSFLNQSRRGPKSSKLYVIMDRVKWRNVCGFLNPHAMWYIMIYISYKESLQWGRFNIFHGLFESGRKSYTVPDSFERHIVPFLFFSGPRFWQILVKKKFVLDPIILYMTLSLSLSLSLMWYRAIKFFEGRE